MSKDFFYANVCHVCKKTSRKMKLMNCRKCYMISYCSTKHKLQDKQNHAALCNAVQRYRILVNQKGIPTSMQLPNQSQWMHSKYQFMTTVQKILNRPLLRFEKQMFMFPRSCITCHKQEDLEYCICANANFCAEHLDNNGHRKQVDCCRHRNQIDCRMMRVSFTFDNLDNWKDEILDMHYMQHLPYDGNFNWEKVGFGVFSFFMKYINRYLNLRTMQEWMIQMYHHTQQISAPLTLLVVMCLRTYINLEKTLDIYVITNEFLDAASLHGWEILLHFIPHLTDLRIVSIGSKLQVESFKACDYLCKKCISRKKKLSYASTPFYRSVIKKHKPCLIISFNARIYEVKANHIDLKTYDYTSDINNWVDIIKYLADLQVGPIILTCYDEPEAKKNMLTIDCILNKMQNAFHAPNLFYGIKPYRNPETESVHFQHDHIVTYSSFSRDG